MLNNQIFFTLYDLSHKNVFLDKIIIFTADKLPYLVVVAAVIFLLYHHEVFSKDPFKAIAQKWKEIVLVFFSGVTAWCFSYLLKYLIHTPRPFDKFSQVVSLFPEHGFAFPSGHATFYMALAIAIFFSHRKAGYYFIFLALMIGVARIIAGVHFPIDILGGFILGALIALIIRLIYDKFYPKHPVTLQS